MGEGDAPAGLERAPVNHAALEAIVANGLHGELDVAVIYKDVFAGRDISREVGVIDRQCARGGGGGKAGDADGIALHEEEWQAIRGRTRAQFGPAKVHEHADRSAHAGGDFAHEGGGMGVLFERAVAGVEAGDIHPRADHGFDGLRAQ